MLRMGLDQKEEVTRLMTLDLAGCRSFSGGALNHLLAKVRLSSSLPTPPTSALAHFFFFLIIYRAPSSAKSTSELSQW